MSAIQTKNDETTARQLLLSLRLLDGRRQRLEHELGATKQRYKDELTDVTKRMNAKIDEGLPVDDEDCRKRLRTIQQLFRERQRTEEDKSEAIDEVKSSLKSVEASIVEVIRSEPSSQQSLEFDGDGLPGMSLTTDTARVIAVALEDAEGQGAETTPDMDELRGRLNELGAKLRVVGDDEPSKPMGKGKKPTGKELLDTYDKAAAGDGDPDEEDE